MQSELLLQEVMSYIKSLRLILWCMRGILRNFVEKKHYPREVFGNKACVVVVVKLTCTVDFLDHVYCR